MITSPCFLTGSRLKKAASPKRRSIGDVSRDYFRSEHVWFLLAELLIFALLAAVALWPIVDAAAAIQTMAL